MSMHQARQPIFTHSQNKQTAVATLRPNGETVMLMANPVDSRETFNNILSSLQGLADSLSADFAISSQESLCPPEVAAN